MTIKINYSKKSFSKSVSNIILFADEKFKFTNTTKILTNSEQIYITDLLKTYDLKKNLFIFEINSKKKNYFNID